MDYKQTAKVVTAVIIIAFLIGTNLLSLNRINTLKQDVVWLKTNVSLKDSVLLDTITKIDTIKVIDYKTKLITKTDTITKINVVEKIVYKDRIVYKDKMPSFMGEVKLENGTTYRYISLDSFSEYLIQENIVNFERGTSYVTMCYGGADVFTINRKHRVKLSKTDEFNLKQQKVRLDYN